MLSIILLVLNNICLNVVGQVNGKSNHHVSMGFMFPKLETVANKSVFNILSIRNNSAYKFNGKLKLVQPDGWTIIGENEVDLNIAKGDSILIPVRIIASKNVLGEVAYAIVATLYDKNNVTISSEYCFINIPRVSDLKIESPNRIIYFNNKTGEAKFNYRLKNNGNVNELVQLNFIENEYLAIDGKEVGANYSYEYNIPAYTDTILEINVSLMESPIDKKDFFKLDLNTHTHDSIYKSSLWFNKLSNIYSHTIPQDNKCAILEFTASDILSTRKPRYSLMAKGSVLLKNNIDIYYYYRKLDLEEDISNYYNDRGYIGIKNNYFKLHAGTVQNLFNEYVFGLGGISEVKYKKMLLGGYYSSNENLQQTFFGGKTGFTFPNKANVLIGYSENNIGLEGISSKIIHLGTELNFLKRNKLILKTYFNNTNYAHSTTTFDKKGLAILGNYSASYNKFRISTNFEYGSPEYSGISRGKNQITANLFYSLNKLDYINFLYSKHDYVNVQYINNVGQPIQRTYNDNYTLFYKKSINKKFSFNIGPGYAIEKFNIPYISLNSNQFFKTNTSKILAGIRYNDRSRNIFISPKIILGKIYTLGEQNTNRFQSVNIMKFNLYSVYKDMKLYVQYQNGPSGIYNQYYYFNSGYLTKWLYVMPSFNKTIFNNKVNIDLRANYRYDITLDDRYLAFNTFINFFLPYDITLWLLNSINTNTKRNQINNSSVRYTTVFFEAGIRKDINCKQPRFQYYNLDIVFFKDLNGNRIKEKNEPGLRNVLATIEPDFDIEDNNEKKDFISQKLLTGSDGTISYGNIVNGAYRLKYVLIGDMVGNFNREEMENKFSIEKDKTVYIPYLENNRIIGKVILNRDPLSSLGRIDVSNIRVIAQDTKGHTYSALTDKEGNFILYTPVTDYYVVKINNIFYESFDVQQSEFVVKFNGYKQFEVNFVFNEKKRQINFNTETEKADIEDELNMDELKAIRKTTLSGKIRDAISLEPVGASIEIIDNKTNKVISSAISNKLNGNYSISYVANENYRIVVKAPGYAKYSENLYIEQVISIQNIAKEIMIKKE